MEILERLKGVVAESDNPVLFEFGMCDGYHSNIILEILSNSGKPFIYHGFEPVKELYENIRLKYNPNLGKVYYWNKAIADKVGFMEFFKSGGYRIENGQVKDHYYGSSSIRKPKLVTQAWKDMTFKTITVETTTFDAHVNHFGLKDKLIDFVWADIQGAEVDLINGGKETFQSVRYFYTEYANSEYYEGEIGLYEICKMLPDFKIVEDYGGDVLLKNKKIS